MSRKFYSIRINNIDIDKSMKINEIFNLKSNMSDLCCWGYEFVETENEGYNNYPEKLLDIIEKHYVKLLELNVMSNLSFWVIYEYDEQCNMEFLPNISNLLGKMNITLCISCYQTENI